MFSVTNADIGIGIVFGFYNVQLNYQPTREEHMGCEFCHTVVLSADNLTATMEAGEGRTMVSCLGIATILLLSCDPDGGEGGGGGGGGTHLGTVHGQLLQVIRDLTL